MDRAHSLKGLLGGLLDVFSGPFVHYFIVYLADIFLPCFRVLGEFYYYFIVEEVKHLL